MLNCKYMATPVNTDMKLLSDKTSELVDLVHEESLMYLMNTKSYICFAVNTLSQHLVKSRCVHLIAAKHDEVP